jgi:hypothetical protein
MGRSGSQPTRRTGSGAGSAKAGNLSIRPVVGTDPTRPSSRPYSIVLRASRFEKLRASRKSSRTHIYGGWKVDITKGDPGHPGVSDIFDESNDQAKASLRDHKNYNYQAKDPYIVQVSGTICGGAGIGASPAIFVHQYVVHETK